MVVILDEKQMPPASLPAPPPYSNSPSGAGTLPRPRATFVSLPPHILLYIVHLTLPQSACARAGGDGKVERQRKVLYWMTVSLRLVCRSVYVACMHVLRSTYLPAYTSMIRAPYSSDPFPLSAPGADGAASTSAPPAYLASPVYSGQRETQVLDLFLAAKVRDDVWADDTELHLEREEAFQDVFDLLQPRARLEDLVRAYGTDAGVVSASTDAAASPSSSRSPAKGTRRVPFGALSCSFSPRSAALVLAGRAGRRTIAEVPRARDERLEHAARRLVRALEVWEKENYAG
ncbi:hypothetical protein DFH11DRAFT_533127 [Phellopilus nigrolimitatus]|nr:hypothetical protein DFH11DRAFT_533127 [Phellopilus nigrolimitatus]